MLTVVLVTLFLFKSVNGQSKFKILVRAATLQAKKTSGKDWDALGNRPDVYCTVLIDGKSVFVSGQAQDTLTPRWWTGTEYWDVKPNSFIEIKLYDGDAGKLLSRAGVAGIAIQPDLPNIGKRIINDQLLKTNTDDLVAHWKGTFADLSKQVRLVNRDVPIRAEGSGKGAWVANNGLEQFVVRIVQKESSYSVLDGKSSRFPAQIGLRSCSLNETKNSVKMKWDVGVGAFRNPDLQYIIYVNGSPIVLGAKNQDSYAAVWNSKPPKLNLVDADLVAVSITDSDAGTLAAQGGSTGILFSSALSFSAKQKLFEELSKASTDDQVFAWECEWGKLRTLGSTINLDRLKSVGLVLADNGLKNLSLQLGENSKPTVGRDLSVHLGAVTIASTKSNGKAWDFGGGKPDPFAKVFVSNSKSGWDLIGESKEIKDSYTGALSWSSGKRTFQSPKSIKIVLYDSDVASDDPIDTFVVPIPKTAGKKVLTATNTRRLEVEFR